MLTNNYLSGLLGILIELIKIFPGLPQQILLFFCLHFVKGPDQHADPGVG